MRSPRSQSTRGCGWPGRRWPCRRRLIDPRDNRGVLLVVDVGNTHTHFGAVRDGEIAEHWRVATDRTSTSDELAAQLRGLLELRGLGFSDVSASVMSSTVPELAPQ